MFFQMILHMYMVERVAPHTIVLQSNHYLHLCACWLYLHTYTPGGNSDFAEPGSRVRSFSTRSSRPSQGGKPLPWCRHENFQCGGCVWKLCLYAALIHVSMIAMLYMMLLRSCFCCVLSVCVQTQFHESPLFLSYFKEGLRYMLS